MPEPENKPKIAAIPSPDSIARAVETAFEADPELALETPEAPKAASGNMIKMAIDFGAPLAFGLSYFIAGKFGHFPKVNNQPSEMPLLIATGVLVATSAVALIAAYVLEKRLAWMPLIVGVFAIMFGGLTLFFHNTVFIKIKLTILNLLFGGVLLGGLAFRKNPLKAMMGEALPLKDEAWGPLTLAYGLFFIAVGLVNEFIWRSQPEALWVTWKSSLFIVTLIFSLCLTPYLMKHMKPELVPEADGNGKS